MSILVGFRFHPPDEEIISLLSKKRLDPDFCVQKNNKVEGCKIFPEYNSVMIGNEKYLIFCKHGHVYKKSNAGNIMHEFHSQHNRLHKIETLQLPSHHMMYSFRNHVAENSFSRVEPQQLPSNHLPSDLEIMLQKILFRGVDFEQVPPHNMAFNYRNHVVENIFTMVKKKSIMDRQWMRNIFRTNAINGSYFRMNCNYYQVIISILIQETMFLGKKFAWQVEYQLPSPYLTFDNRNHVAENILPTEESQLLPIHHLSSHSRNHVAENMFFSYRNYVAEKYFSIGRISTTTTSPSDLRF